MGFFSVDVRAHRACRNADSTRRSFDLSEKAALRPTFSATTSFRYGKIIVCFGFCEASFISTSDLTRR